jgi:hypothetical protein
MSVIKPIRTYADCQQVVVNKDDWDGSVIEKDVTPAEGVYKLIMHFNHVDSGWLEVKTTGTGSTVIIDVPTATQDETFYVPEFYMSGSNAIKVRIGGGTLGASSNDNANYNLVKVY